MPFCPVCRDEFEDWVKICPDCNVALDDELPPLPERKKAERKTETDESLDEPLVEVAVAPNELIASMWAGTLEEYGIRCLLKGENLGGGMYRRYMEPYRIFVLKTESEQAREILVPFIEEPEGGE